jgi:Coenzyme PQQ synthesis protein D (PqqD)
VSPRTILPASGDDVLTNLRVEMVRATAGGPEYALPPHVYSREVDGQTVLLNLESEMYFGLDRVGTDIVKRLTEQPATTAFASLVDDYEVDLAVLRRDVDALVTQLLDAGLLERIEPQP